MEYIDAIAQINDCDNSDSDLGLWEDFADSELEDFIVNEPLVPFGPRPAEYSSEGEGSSTGHDVLRESRTTPQYDTPVLGAPPPMLSTREPTPDPFLPSIVWFWKGSMRGWEPVQYDDSTDFIDE